MCHTVIFIINSELARTSKRRMNKIFVRAVSTEVVLYLIIALGGYLGLCEYTPAVIINRDNLSDSTDYFILVARALFPLYLSIGIPLNASPLRK